jgi:aspartyl aminopeptidase
LHLLILKVDRNVNDNFTFNQETEFIPILGQVASQLNSQIHPPANSDTSAASSIQDNHHSSFLSLLAEELASPAEDIHDFELYVNEFYFCF